MATVSSSSLPYISMPKSCLKERLSGYRGNIDQGKGREAGPAVSPGNSEILSPITFQLTPVLGQAGKNVDYAPLMSLA